MRVVFASNEMSLRARGEQALQIVTESLRSSATITITKPQTQAMLIAGARMHAPTATVTREADRICHSSGATARLPDPADGAGGRAQDPFGSRRAILMAAGVECPLL